MTTLLSVCEIVPGLTEADYGVGWSRISYGQNGMAANPRSGRSTSRGCA